MTVKKVIRKVLIVPYFGSFNSYFKLWLNSCENNPDIDWLIFTDISINEILPLNVRVIEKNFDTLRKEFQKNLILKYV